MRKLVAASVALALLALPTAAPVSAMPVSTALSTADRGSVDQVAFRHFGGFRRGGFGGFHRGGFGGFHRRFGGNHFGAFGGRRFFGGRRYYGGRRFGYGVGAGIAGLAAGAIIGGTVAAAARANNAVAYCESRFKSYDPSTGTYLGYDGRRHACP